MKYSLTALLLVLFFGMIHAQRPNSFSFDQTKFIGEFEAFIKSSSKGDIKNLGEEFAGYYNSGKFSSVQKLQIIKLCNQMLDKNASLSPDFENYLKTINSFITNNFLSKFDNWHKTLSASLQSSKADFHNFLLISKNVFAENKLLDLGGYSWNSSSLDAELQMLDEPVFVFKSLDLFCFTPGDTFEVYNTSGRFYPSKNIWIGKGGKVDWTRVGLDSSKVYAQLKNYKIDFNDGLMIADSATFYNKEIFAKPLIGRVSDKPLGQSQGEKSIFPQFEGYSSTFSGITFGKAQFRGGFGMRGALVVGKGVGETKSELWFYFKAKPVIKVSAEEFYIRENKISSQKSEVSIYLDKDSIYHPQLLFNYYVKEDKISLYRDDKVGISSAPFTDFFHNVEFYVDEIKWDINNPKIDIDNMAGDAPVKFESANYFRDYYYEKLQGILDYNPLARIKKYCEDRDTKSFTIESYAAANRSNISDIRIQMILLNDKGFVNFDAKKNIVTIKNKLKDFVNAHYGKTDYDAISFNSIISAIPNAHISLINNDLVIQGVPKFYFSDSQNVYILPKDQVITLKKNRNMDFSGKVRAGMVDLYGNNFAFDYNNFKIRLNNIDSLKFLIYDEKQGYMSPIKSVIQNIYGTLEIDHPFNKSGRRKYPKYPIFTSDVGSKVFYDYHSTQNGVYDREKFYFAVDPFTLDSLADLNLLTLQLAGTFVSGGIVPEMPEKLSMQPDKSLGFYIPNDTTKSYTLYRGKGSSKMSLSLSNEGLIGDGVVSYLASRSTSNRFVFLLDSMNAKCKNFENDRTSLFPTIIKSKNTTNHWIPYQDTMFIANKDEPIRVGNEMARLTGSIILTPSKMNAKGRFDIRDGEIESEMYELKPDQILSDDARFRQKWPGDSTRIAFETESVKSVVNLDKMYADFTYNKQGVINNTFKYNNYVGSFEKLRWDIIPRTLEFKGPTPKENPKLASYLLSTKGSQDKLTFYTSSVKMKVTDYVMNIEGIPFINIADSRIMPDSGKAVIRENAEMDMLTNASIYGDTITKFHKLERATVKINGRTDIVGAGTYIYTDKNNTQQEFYFEKLYVADKKFIEGTTVIRDTSVFYVGPKMRFMGNTILRTNTKNLAYNGFFKAEHKMFLPRTDWFRSEEVINPDSVYINVKTTLTNLSRQSLTNGFYISNDSTHVYPALFSRKRNTSDAELFGCSGVFTYNEKFDEFQLGPYDKVFGTAKRGNLMVLSLAKKIIFGEGVFNFGFKSDGFNLLSAGMANYKYEDTSFTLRAFMSLDFLLPQQALKMMFDSLSEQTVNSPANFQDKRLTTLALSQFLDEKIVNKFSGDLADELGSKNSDPILKTILITEINLEWNQAKRAFISTGDFGIRSFDKLLLERRLNGKMEIVKRRSGDDFTFYIQNGTNDSWYYFKFQKNTMAVASSDIFFNDVIKQTQDKISKERKDYRLRQANFSERNKFVRSIKQ